MLKLNYGQFTGTIQVMKAVGNHMVLTFCENLPGSQLYSVILSRKPGTLSIDVRFDFWFLNLVLTFNFSSIYPRNLNLNSINRTYKVYVHCSTVVVYQLYQFDEFATDQIQ